MPQAMPLHGQGTPGPMMPGPMPPPMAGPRARNWRERFMRNYGMGIFTSVQKGELTIPNWLVGKPILFFFVALFACWIAFGYVPNENLWITSILSVILFFYVGVELSQRWAHVKEKQFLRHVFWTGLVIRLIWVLYLYFFFNPEFYGNTYGNDSDTGWYMRFGIDLSRWLAGESKHTLADIIQYQAASFDDTGYPMWLGVIYLLTGNISDVLIPFIVKSFMGAYCAVCIYRVAKRHFGDGTARMAAIFVCLNPNMIYWCGTMMKEADMVFLVCLSIDNFDRVLSSGKQLTFKALLPGTLAGVALMFFRMVLGLVVFMAVFAHIIMASRKVMSVGKKILAGVLVGTVLFVGMGDRIMIQSKKMVETVQSDAQAKNMEGRAYGKTGNAFAKYAGAAVFAPLIFTIPFPTINQANEIQYTQMQLAGGSYIKNIFSFFVILVLFLMLVSGEWRRHVFLIAYTCGYLMVLVMSAFAQSGRFHMPIMPMLMLFAAYGIQLAKGNKKLQRGFTLVLVLEVVVCLAWNWFKLKGRGMI